jgi:AcrR family transcriptional regulator
MPSPPPAVQPSSGRRRDQQKDQTRLDLALAAFELARQHGLAAVRVPQIAAATGVSPRTFNNYFPSKEAAIAWPATRRGTMLAASLDGRPVQEPLADALAEAAASLYQQDEMDGLPAGWLRDFRALVAAEPALHGEYLKAASTVETTLAAGSPGAWAQPRTSWNPRCWPRWRPGRSGPPSCTGPGTPRGRRRSRTRFAPPSAWPCGAWSPVSSGRTV